MAAASAVRAPFVPSTPTVPPTRLFSTEHTDGDLERIASSILARMHAIDSSHQIIHRWDLVDLQPANLEFYYRKFGVRLLHFVQYQLRLENVREAIDVVTTHVRNLKYSVSSELVAVSNLGVGECGETSTYIAMQCGFLGIETLRLVASDVPIAEYSKRNYTHSFVLLGVKEKEIKELAVLYKQNLKKLLSHLKHGVLFDTLLREIFPIRECATKGKNFLRYINVHRINCFWDVVPSYDRKRCLKIQTEADSISTLAMRLLRQEPILGIAKKDITGRSSSFKMMEQQVLDLWSDEFIFELNKTFSKANITWKKDLKNGIRIWCEGSFTTVTIIHEHLSKLGIAMTVERMSSKLGSELLYKCELTHSNLDQLRTMIPLKPLSVSE